MKMTNLIQGTPEWLAHRDQHYNASDAPAMMGCSPYKTRAQLLREKTTGVAAAVDTNTQRRFDDGHRFEELARPLAEGIIGEQLFPVTGSQGRFSASFDGLTLMQDVAFEHKTLSAALADVLHADCKGHELPLHYRVQMEHQCMVSGAQRVLFMASRWNDDDTLAEERYCWYHADEDLRRQIVDGWAQFERDLSAYELPPGEPVAAVGKAPDTLPALRIEVTGEVTASNLAQFKETALSTIRAVNRELRTDQDFADADKAVKWCADVESRLKAAKEHALSQTASIDALFKALDDIGAEARTVRLDLEKLTKRRKEEVRDHAVSAARKALDEHIADLNGELAPMRLLPVTSDFASAIKGLRSISSMQDALDTTLAQAKIAADGQARGIRANVAAFKTAADGLEFLFSDLGQIVHKAADDFTTLVQARIATHKAAEAAREAQRKAAEEARIAAEAQRQAAAIVEQQRRADAEAAARAESDRLEALAAERRAALAAQDTNRTAGLDALRALTPQADAGVAAMLAAMPPEPSPKPAAIVAPVAETPTLTIGAINERLGFCSVTGAQVASLGVTGVKAPKGPGLLFAESQYRQIVRGLIAKLHGLHNSADPCDITEHQQSVPIGLRYGRALYERPNVGAKLETTAAPK